MAPGSDDKFTHLVLRHFDKRKPSAHNVPRQDVVMAILITQPYFNFYIVVF